jgi:hypothetical protein
MKKTISFVSTIIPADQFKKKYDIGSTDGDTLTIYHIGEVLDSEIGAYRCYECSIPTSLFDEDEVKAAYAKFDERVKAAELAYAISKKEEEITAYDKSDKVNGFILNGLLVWLDKATRVGLMNSTTIAKAAGQETTTLWLGGLKLVVDCDKAIRLLSALEMYALECFNVTASHKQAVSQLTTIEEVEAYDYKAGYPKMLEMSV